MSAPACVLCLTREPGEHYRAPCAACTSAIRPNRDRRPPAMTLDDFLRGDLPDPNTCPYCDEPIRCHWREPVSVRAILERDESGELAHIDSDDYMGHGDSNDGEHFSCPSYRHVWDDLDALDTAQREEHALGIVMEDAGRAPAGARITVIYSHDLFAGRRSRMARISRANGIAATAGYPFPPKSAYARRERWARFVALPTPPSRDERDLADVIGVAA